MKSLRFLSVCFLLVGCGKFKDQEPPEYVKDAYKRQNLEKEEFLDGPVDEATREDLVIEIAERSRPGWERYPYETLEEWFERQISQVEKNAALIDNLEVQLIEMSNRQTALSDQIHIFLSENEKLREQIHFQEEALDEEAFADKISTPPSPFKVHLVREGENLKQIALKYYGDETKIVDIMRWNRGWIRHSEELIAGVPLVLFPPGTLNQSQEIVENFIETIRD